MSAKSPWIVVFSSLFPSEVEPLAGVFIRERMFRVGRELPITVVSPQPWFPLQALLRRWRPGYRLPKLRRDRMGDVQVLRPRFFAVPGMLRRFDGMSMAIAAWSQLRLLRKHGRADIIDAHFAFPDGYAASLLGRWLNIPVTITLRGTEPRHASDARLRPLIAAGLKRAALVFSVSASLRELALQLGVSKEKTRVIGNGVDLRNFAPVPRLEARKKLRLPANSKVIVSVGALVERKGFHRIIELLPALLQTYPDLHYLVVGGASPEGDWTAQLRQRTLELGLGECVHFLGPVRPEDLHVPLSAADVFALATSNEGWANVFLEAMACGLPVITTSVGGNAEVVCRDELGSIVPYGDAEALKKALVRALAETWDREGIRRYAEMNTWDSRIEALVMELRGIGVDMAQAPRSGLAAGA